MPLTVDLSSSAHSLIFTFTESRCFTNAIITVPALQATSAQNKLLEQALDDTMTIDRSHRQLLEATG
jgi:hypothetical protein